MAGQKTFQDLTISNAFMFSAVMADEEICRKVIELALGFPIAKVRVCVEKTMAYHSEYHGIRLDVYAADENHTRFNVEMQVVFQSFLVKRGRYYHSYLDMDALEKGVSYGELPDTYVIFICDFDPFGKGLYRYTCESKCVEADFPINDGAKSIYLSTHGKNAEAVPPELVKFLRYVRASAQESEEDFQDSFVKCLQDKVKKIKNDRGMEERYMLLEEMMRDEHKMGYNEGWREATAAYIITLLEMHGQPSEELRKRIEAEQDNDKLSQWLRLAARAESLDEFTDGM